MRYERFEVRFFIALGFVIFLLSCMNIGNQMNKAGKLGKWGSEGDPDSPYYELEDPWR